MGDLVGFKGYLNKSAPYVPEHEHEALWKAANGRRYHDFNFGTEFNSTCQNFPRLFWDNGSEVEQAVYDSFGGCYNGDFDQVRLMPPVITLDLGVQLADTATVWRYRSLRCLRRLPTSAHQVRLGARPTARVGPGCAREAHDFLMPHHPDVGYRWLPLRQGHAGHCRRRGFFLSKDARVRASREQDQLLYSGRDYGWKHVRGRLRR